MLQGAQEIGLEFGSQDEIQTEVKTGYSCTETLEERAREATRKMRTEKVEDSQRVEMETLRWTQLVAGVGGACTPRAKTEVWSSRNRTEPMEAAGEILGKIT